MIYCLILHGLRLCCCWCDCVFSVHVLVRFVLLFSCAVLWFVFALCLVVVECVLVCLSGLCVSFVVDCETLYVLFACAFRVCGLLSVFVCAICDLLCDVVWCVCLCAFWCESV